jgi:hypothetical protein
VWTEVEENIDKFITAKNNSNTQWWLSACISVSAFNVYDFFETYEHYASKGIGIYVNVVHDHHGVRILPTELKNSIVAKLQACESKYLPQQWRQDSDMIIRHLLNTQYSEHEWREFWKEIKVRDAIRKESFEETFPEYYSEMKNYLIG